MPDAPVLVRNTEDGPTVFSDLVTKEVIEWKGKDDPSGGDIQRVPAKFVTENVNFLNAITRGLFEVVEADQEVLDALAASQKADRERRRDVSTHAVEGLVEEGAANDTVGLGCIGPKRDGSLCGKLVPIKEKAQKEHPPLCPEHAGLVMQYSLVSDPKGTIGEEGEKFKWVRMTIDPPDRAVTAG